MAKAIISFSKKIFNKIYIRHLKTKSRYLVLYGGAGSGKSVFAAQKIIIRLLSEKNHKFLLIRKVGRTIRQSQFQLIKSLIYEYKLEQFFTFTENLTIKCVNGNEVIASGIDDVEKLKSITGVTGIWIEEATELSADDFYQIDLRLRGFTTNYKQIILTFNPISSENWAIKNFILMDNSNATVIKSTYKNNKFIDKEYIEILEGLKDKDENLYTIYSLGEIGIIKHLIYTPFKIINEYPLYPNEIIYGLDFGFNVPTAFIEIQKYDADYYLKELLYKAKLTNTALIKELKKLIPEKHRHSRSIYADNAEPDRIAEIEQAGFLIQPADKAVIRGIDFLKTLNIYSCPENVNINKEVETYKWKETKDGIILDEPVKFNDHAMDAIRYAIYTHEKFNNKIEMEAW